MQGGIQDFVSVSEKRVRWVGGGGVGGGVWWLWIYFLSVDSSP